MAQLVLRFSRRHDGLGDLFADAVAELAAQPVNGHFNRPFR
jgi:hypothetical protein